MEYFDLVKKNPDIFTRVAKKMDLQIKNGFSFNYLAFLKNINHTLRMKWIEEAKKIIKNNSQEDKITNRLMTLGFEQQYVAT